MAPPEKVYACNCSICRRAGWLLAFVPENGFESLTPEAELTDYQLKKKTIHHLFCKTCGIRAFSRGKRPDGTPVMPVNVRCLDGLDATELPVQEFDGASL
jgi:hypothetical protein